MGLGSALHLEQAGCLSRPADHQTLGSPQLFSSYLQKFQHDTVRDLGCRRDDQYEDTAAAHSAARTNDYDDYDQHTRSERERAWLTFLGSLFFLSTHVGWTFTVYVFVD